MKNTLEKLSKKKKTKPTTKLEVQYERLFNLSVILTNYALSNYQTNELKINSQ